MARTTPMQFIHQTRAEISKITWPERREVLLTSIMVLALALFLATFFGLTDLVIRWILQWVLGFFG